MLRWEMEMRGTEGLDFPLASPWSQPDGLS